MTRTFFRHRVLGQNYLCINTEKHRKATTAYQSRHITLTLRQCCSDVMCVLRIVIRMITAIIYMLGVPGGTCRIFPVNKNLTVSYQSQCNVTSLHHPDRPYADTEYITNMGKCSRRYDKLLQSILVRVPRIQYMRTGYTLVRQRKCAG